MESKPTIVLVHGAFADASGWDGVIGHLQADGYPVLAVANPLRGLAADSAYVRSVVDTLAGPVVLVGHSYGGAVISNVATGAANVTALVFVAAFAPDEGEAIGQFADPTQYPGAALTPDALVVRPFPGGADASIDPARFREIFAADLPESETVKLAVRQRPVALAAFEEPSGAPAWRTLPCWYLVCGQDKAISPVAERFFAQRMDAETVEIDASHAGFVSHAEPTAKLIASAAR
jgi:pimeloyl-ACP methyl ester carboxylesterase